MRTLVVLVVAGCAAPAITTLGWVLVVPPNVYQDGAIRMDDAAPLSQWRRLGAFADVGDCRRFRDARVDEAPNDEEWATWSMAQCVTTEQAGSGDRVAP